jgi:hypothetical protein
MSFAIIAIIIAGITAIFGLAGLLFGMLAMTLRVLTDSNGNDSGDDEEGKSSSQM